MVGCFLYLLIFSRCRKNCPHLFAFDVADQVFLVLSLRLLCLARSQTPVLPLGRAAAAQGWDAVVYS